MSELCELIIISLTTGIISGVVAAYVVRFIDWLANKKDRHSPKSGL